MNTKEQIAVMQAYLDGKAIQMRSYGDKQWKEVGTPLWDWMHFDFRIKPEQSDYRPYNSAQEFMIGSRCHGPYIKCPDDEYILPCRINCGMIEWTGRYSCSDNKVLMSKSFECLLSDKYMWQDGTPCGIKHY